jgi:hypothetical protein
MRFVEREKKEEDKKIKKYIFILYFYYFKKLINNVMIKTKSKNQNYVSNTIFFLNCDFSCETKTMYQTNFFLQS